MLDAGSPEMAEDLETQTAVSEANRRTSRRANSTVHSRNQNPRHTANRCGETAYEPAGSAYVRGNASVSRQGGTC